MQVFCPRCGAEYVDLPQGHYRGVNNQCRGCGLAVSEEVPMLAPGDDQVAFVLDDWPVTHRGEATAMLTENQIPYRWEAGLALVVPAEVEEQVDAILDEAEEVAETALATEGLEGEIAEGELVERGDFTGDEDDEDDAGDEDRGDEDGDGEGDEDGGEDAQMAMSDLYVVADRLQHQPWEGELQAELAKLSTYISTLLPPYGISRATWNRLGDLAAAVLADIEADADDETVTTSTRALREFVREYV